MTDVRQLTFIILAGARVFAWAPVSELRKEDGIPILFVFIISQRFSRLQLTMALFAFLVCFLHASSSHAVTVHASSRSLSQQQNHKTLRTTKVAVTPQPFL